MIPLNTERLRLRPLRQDDGDAAFLRRLHANPDLARFIPSALVPEGAAGETVLAAQLERFTSLAEHPVQGFSAVELLATGEAVGLVMVKPIPPSGGGEPSVLEIGWRQVAEHCGHGYITEAASAVLEAVHARGVVELVAVTDPANSASQAVAERIGMQWVRETDAFYDARCVLFRSCRERPASARWLPERWELLPESLYAYPGPLRDRLVAAILSGRKLATTALLAGYEIEGVEPTAPGGLAVVVDSDAAPVCVTRETAVEVMPLGEVGLEHVLAEGEGHESVAEWRAGHESFWTGPEERAWYASSGAEPPVIDDTTPVVCTRFEVVAQRPA